MANKFDLKIINVGLTIATVDVVPAVPKGKTRFVCFIKHSAVTGGTVTIGEGDTTATMTTPKDVTVMAAAGILAYPDKVDVDNPLFSIAEEKFLVLTSDVDDGTITVVYFDE